MPSFLLNGMECLFVRRSTYFVNLVLCITINKIIYSMYIDVKILIQLISHPMPFVLRPEDKDKDSWPRFLYGPTFLMGQLCRACFRKCMERIMDTKYTITLTEMQKLINKNIWILNAVVVTPAECLSCHIHHVLHRIWQPNKLDNLNETLVTYCVFTWVLDWYQNKVLICSLIFCLRLLPNLLLKSHSLFVGKKVKTA